MWYFRLSTGVSMSANTSSNDTTLQALDTLLDELRDFIDKIQQPRVKDRPWAERRREAGQALAEKFSALSARAEEKHKEIRESLKGMSERLRAYADELGERPDMKALKERRDSLARSYEELLLELRNRRIARAAALTQSRQLKPVNYARNLYHAANALVAVSLYHLVLTREQALWVLGTIFAVFGTLEVTRRFSDRWNDFLVDKVFGAISRPSERYRVNSATVYLLALMIITFSFPKLPVEAAILVLGLGDPMASLIGKRFGRRKLFRDKSLAGTLAFFATAFVAVSILLGLSAAGLSPLRVVLAAGGIAAVGAATELFSSRIDDNFSIPIACAVVGALLL
jgi:dolichol kinase